MKLFLLKIFKKKEINLYKIEFDKKVKKFLVKTEQHIFDKFQEKIEVLALNPHDNNLDIRKLKGQNGYRLRIGKYRFLYEVFEDKILIYFFDANSRGDIY